MRIWFSGPRIFGIRPGVSFGREDLGRGARMSVFESRVFVALVIAGAIIGMAVGVWIANLPPPANFVR
jgi:hypothetical protein